MYICIHPYTCHTTAYSPRTGDDHFDSLISAHRRSDSFLACNTNADSSRTGHAHFDSFIFAQRRLEPFFCMLYECIQPTNWRRAYSLIRMFLTYSYLCRGVRSFFFWNIAQTLTAHKLETRILTHSYVLNFLGFVQRRSKPFSNGSSR